MQPSHGHDHIEPTGGLLDRLWRLAQWGLNAACVEDVRCGRFERAVSHGAGRTTARASGSLSRVSQVHDRCDGRTMADVGGQRQAVAAAAVAMDGDLAPPPAYVAQLRRCEFPGPQAQLGRLLIATVPAP